MRVEQYEGLISSFVNETLKVKDIDRVRDLIASDKKLEEMYLLKKQQKEFCEQLIPSINITNQIRGKLLSEVDRVNNDVLPQAKHGLIKRIYKFLTEPIIEI